MDVDVVAVPEIKSVNQTVQLSEEVEKSQETEDSKFTNDLQEEDTSKVSIKSVTSSLEDTAQKPLDIYEDLEDRPQDPLETEGDVEEPPKETEEAFLDSLFLLSAEPVETTSEENGKPKEVFSEAENDTTQEASKKQIECVTLSPDTSPIKVTETDFSESLELLTSPCEETDEQDKVDDPSSPKDSSDDIVCLDDSDTGDEDACDEALMDVKVEPENEESPLEPYRNERKAILKTYTRSQLNNIFLQRMRRKSLRWLSYQRKKNRATMQIVDDDTMVCETEIPLHHSLGDEKDSAKDQDQDSLAFEQVEKEAEPVLEKVEAVEAKSENQIETTVCDEKQKNGQDEREVEPEQLEAETDDCSEAMIVEEEEPCNKNGETPSQKKESEKLAEVLLAKPEDPEPPKESSNELVNTEPENKKRKAEESTAEEGASNPTKKLRTELTEKYEEHDKILREYMKTAFMNCNVTELQQHISLIDTELSTLQRMLLAKEEEWNSILHLKKVKEEIKVRLVRKKTILEMNSGCFEKPKPSDTNLQNESNTPPFLPETTLRNLKNLQATKNADKQLDNNSGLILSSLMNSPLHSAPLVSNATALLQNRARMKPSEKDKAIAQKIQRNILPRPRTLPNHEQIIRNLTMSSTSASSAATAEAALNELFNGTSGSAMSGVNMGRQGPIKAVSSIIADFREKHPEQIPRRGRRLKDKHESLSRPSSTDSSHSNPATSNLATSNFKDILSQFMKMTPEERQILSSPNSIMSALNMSAQFQQAQFSALAAAQQKLVAQKEAPVPSKPIQAPYPEVTLHPVGNNLINNSSNELNQSSNSLLHGILTKSTSRSSSANKVNNSTSNNSVTSGYSPTLARLLTSPERISVQQQPNHNYQTNPFQSLAAGLNLANKSSEITITPVMNAHNLQQTLLAHQQGQKNFLNLDDHDDDNSHDRLVIDESDNQQNSYGGNNSQDLENEVPKCQGCKKHESRFVCAGCGNQWYCSRECQVSAWDEHSEICNG